MKRKLVTSILSATALFAVTSPGFGQGKINLNNYTLSGNRITYGFGWAPGLAGTGIQNGGWVTWSVGFYYALGDVTASVSPDPTGVQNPAVLGGGLGLATGVPGDTTTIGNIPAGGYFTTTSDAIINGWTAGPVTFEVIVYNGADWNSSLVKAHSPAFLLTPVAAGAPQAAPQISTSFGGMPGFSVNNTPEPTMSALAGVGAALFLLFRRNRR